MRRVLTGALMLLAFCVLYTSAFWGAHATWRPEYAALPADVQGWCAQAELTPAAAKRLGFFGCCKFADVVKAKFKVETADGHDAWYWQHGEVWERIPDDIIHWNEQAPDNRPTLFALAHDLGPWPAGTLTCFYPPGGAS